MSTDVDVRSYRSPSGPPTTTTPCRPLPIQYRTMVGYSWIQNYQVVVVNAHWVYVNAGLASREEESIEGRYRAGPTAVARGMTMAVADLFLLLFSHLLSSLFDWRLFSSSSSINEEEVGRQSDSVWEGLGAQSVEEIWNPSGEHPEKGYGLEK